MLVSNLKSIKVPDTENYKSIILNKVEEGSSKLKERLKLELMKFIHSKELKDFQDMLNR